MDHSSGTVDAAFDALSHSHRRSVLVALLDDEQPPELQLIGDGGEMDDEQWRITMKHQHLPKLAGQGFINWDGESVTGVSKGPAFEEIRPLLELLDEEAEKIPGTWVEFSKVDA